MLSMYDEVVYEGKSCFVTDAYEEDGEVLYVVEVAPDRWVDGISERDLELVEE